MGPETHPALRMRVLQATLWGLKLIAAAASRQISWIMAVGGWRQLIARERRDTNLYTLMGRGGGLSHLKYLKYSL